MTPPLFPLVALQIIHVNMLDPRSLLDPHILSDPVPSVFPLKLNQNNRPRLYLDSESQDTSTVTSTRALAELTRIIAPQPCAVSVLSSHHRRVRPYLYMGCPQGARVQLGCIVAGDCRRALASHIVADSAKCFWQISTWNSAVVSYRVVRGVHLCTKIQNVLFLLLGIYSRKSFRTLNLQQISTIF